MSKRNHFFTILITTLLMILIGTGTAEENTIIDINSLSMEELLQLQESIADKLSESEKAETTEKTTPYNRRIVTDLSEYSVFIGKTIKVKTIIERNNEDAPKTTKLVWTSKDTNIATVSNDGTVKGITAGETEIQIAASDDEKINLIIPIIVKASVTDIKVTNSDILLLLDDETKANQKLDYTILPENAFDKSVSFESSNPNVVTIDNEGVLHAVSAGKAIITIKSKDSSSSKSKAAKCNVSVNQAVKKITLINNLLNIGVGKTGTIDYAIYPSSATQKKLTFESTDESIATVSAKGVITGKSAGNCTIICKATDGSGEEAKCLVYINRLATGITVKDHKPGSTWSLMEGESKIIDFTIEPRDASKKTIKWTSYDPSVASVELVKNVYCKIVARKAGETTIVGKPNDGSNIKYTIKLSVESKMSLKYIDLDSYTQWGYHSFKYKLKNTSKNRTIDGLTIRYSGEDVYGNKLRAHGFGDYEVDEVINITIKPGKTKKTQEVTAYGFTNAKRIHVNIVKVHYTDGTTYNINNNDFSWVITY